MFRTTTFSTVDMQLANMRSSFAPGAALLLTIVGMAMPAAADHCGMNTFYGSCGAFAKKSHCWSGSYCYAYKEEDCCEVDGGALAGLIIGIVLFLGELPWGAPKDKAQRGMSLAWGCECTEAVGYAPCKGC